MEAIRIEGLNFTYPGKENRALSDINLSIGEGEFVAICGKSGSGKSTLLRHLRTELKPEGRLEGAIYIMGETIESLGQRRETESIGFVYQSPENQIVTDKVWHELAFGLESLGYKTEEIRSRVAEMASFFGIQTWFHKSVTELSGGQKQLLNLAAVMLLQPKILILDEPTSQLDPIAAADFLDTIKKINLELGTTILITEHRLEEALPMSDRVLVVEDGKIILNGAPKEVGEKLKEMKNDMFVAMPTPMRIYAQTSSKSTCPITVKEGRNWLSDYQREHEIYIDSEFYLEKSERDFSDEEAVIEIKEAFFRYERNLPDVVKGLDLTVKEGEFFALVGGNGTGKTTSLSIIMGLRKPYRGSVKIKEGKTVAMLPQNPQTLFAKKTLELDLYEMFAGKKLSKEEEKRRVANAARLCELEELISMHPYDLSGGERQRAALAKLLLLEPDILLLDEPTKGIDAHFKIKLAGILKKLSATGVTIVMVSHDIEFCASYADSCAMFFDGSLTSTGSAHDFFAGKNFYTTAANRMARSILPLAVLAEDVMRALGVDVKKNPKFEDLRLDLPKKGEGKKFSDDINEISETKIVKLLEHPKDRSKKITPLRVGIAALATVALVLTTIFLKEAFLDYRRYLVRVLMVIELGVGLTAIFPGSDFHLQGDLVQEELSKRKLSKRSLIAIALSLIAIPFTIYLGIFYLDNRKYYFISLLLMFECMIPFAISFENRKPQARELMVIAVLCAIGVAGRVAFFMLPGFKPVLAVAIIAGTCFGAESGFLVGAMIALVSNMYFGQGPLTPWQMFGYGMAGLLAGICFKKGLLLKRRTSMAIFGFIVTFFICGPILDTGAGVTWLREPTFVKLIPYYLAGISYNLIHAFSTFFFLWFLAEPMADKLERIKVKYGLIGN